MESYTTFIEFFGLPGCGKTTLCKQIMKEFDNVNILLMSDVTKEYNVLPLGRKIFLIPYRVWWSLILFLLRCPILPPKLWKIYIGLFKISLTYMYAQRVPKDAIVLIDHGIIQSVVSLLYGRANRLSLSAQKHLANFIRHFSNVRFTYCDIPPDISLERIRLRGRVSGGRLDAIDNDTILYDNLCNQKIVFMKILPIIEANTHYLHFNMIDPNLIDKIKKNL